MWSAFPFLQAALGLPGTNARLPSRSFPHNEQIAADLVLRSRRGAEHQPFVQMAEVDLVDRLDAGVAPKGNGILRVLLIDEFRRCIRDDVLTLQNLYLHIVAAAFPRSLVITRLQLG